MPKLLVLQHVPYEILGTLDPKLRGSGFRIRYVNFGRDPHARPSLDGYRGLVILGGPMNVDQVAQHPHLATEIELIRDAVDRGVPILGICLGAQLIAKALGAEVRAGERKEIGWHDVSLTDEGKKDPLIGHLGERQRVFQWHGDVLDLPSGAVHLASSERCTHQAFRVGTNVYGLQFHLEADESLIERWLGVPELRHDIESATEPIDPRDIRRETHERIRHLAPIADRVFDGFIGVLGGGRRPRRLRTR
ncbi:MAG: glutamine amidotransferase-related protein [Candidatus Binatia bacterium]